MPFVFRTMPCACVPDKLRQQAIQMEAVHMQGYERNGPRSVADLLQHWELSAHMAVCEAGGGRGVGEGEGQEQGEGRHGHGHHRGNRRRRRCNAQRPADSDVGTLVGFAISEVEGRGRGRDVFVHELHVREGDRGRGIGAKLLAQAEALGTDGTVALQVHEANAVAYNFYTGKCQYAPEPPSSAPDKGVVQLRKVLQ
jgi:ribosomal protein S18 acetylase RimI-like enzyme